MKPRKTIKISTLEKELLKRLKNSKLKDGAFRELVNQSKKDLYFQIRRLILSLDDTNDVLQNVYIKIYKSITKFQEKTIPTLYARTKSFIIRRTDLFTRIGICLFITH